MACNCHDWKIDAYGKAHLFPRNLSAKRDSMSNEEIQRANDHLCFSTIYDHDKYRRFEGVNLSLMSSTTWPLYATTVIKSRDRSIHSKVKVDYGMNLRICVAVSRFFFLHSPMGIFNRSRTISDTKLSSCCCVGMCFEMSWAAVRIHDELECLNRQRRTYSGVGVVSKCCCEIIHKKKQQMKCYFVYQLWPVNGSFVHTIKCLASFSKAFELHIM